MPGPYCFPATLSEAGAAEMVRNPKPPSAVPLSSVSPQDPHLASHLPCPLCFLSGIISCPCREALGRALGPLPPALVRNETAPSLLNHMPPGLASWSPLAPPRLASGQAVKSGFRGAHAEVLAVGEPGPFLWELNIPCSVLRVDAMWW